MLGEKKTPKNRPVCLESVRDLPDTPPRARIDLKAYPATSPVTITPKLMMAIVANLSKAPS